MATLTAAANTTYGRVLLTLTWAGIKQATIERQDPDGVWRPVRNAEPCYCFGSTAQFDHEAPMDAAVTYRATSPQAVGTTTTSSAVTLASGGRVWLTHPGKPSLFLKPLMAEVGKRTLPARRGAFKILGAQFPVITTDVRGGDVGEITFVTDGTWAQQNALRALLADGLTLLLRQPAAYGGEAFWVSVGDVGIEPTSRMATSLRRRFTVPYDRVDRPTGASQGPVGLTYASMSAQWATYAPMTATTKTYTALSSAIP